MIGATNQNSKKVLKLTYFTMSAKMNCERMAVIFLG